MTREEYIAAMERNEAERKAIQAEYIDSMPIKPKQQVVIGHQKYWLDSYHIVCSDVQARFYCINPKNGRDDRSKGVQYPEHWRTKMKPCE